MCFLFLNHCSLTGQASQTMCSLKQETECVTAVICASLAVNHHQLKHNETHSHTRTVVDLHALLWWLLFSNEFHEFELYWNPFQLNVLMIKFSCSAHWTLIDFLFTFINDEKAIPSLKNWMILSDESCFQFAMIITLDLLSLLGFELMYAMLYDSLHQFAIGTICHCNCLLFQPQPANSETKFRNKFLVSNVTGETRAAELECTHFRDRCKLRVRERRVTQWLLMTRQPFGCRDFSLETSQIKIFSLKPNRCCN